mmetsp:Transcript_102752/g.229500  ORF Transcript_102752/g.229500 Transcript_102752/m.229500 type:complete len:198 (+) Transcript_102752:592-1185(+)
MEVRRSKVAFRATGPLWPIIHFAACEIVGDGDSDNAGETDRAGEADRPPGESARTIDLGDIGGERPDLVFERPSRTACFIRSAALALFGAMCTASTTFTGARCNLGGADRARRIDVVIPSEQQERPALARTAEDKLRLLALPMIERTASWFKSGPVITPASRSKASKSSQRMLPIAVEAGGGSADVSPREPSSGSRA